MDFLNRWVVQSALLKLTRTDLNEESICTCKVCKNWKTINTNIPVQLGCNYTMKGSTCFLDDYQQNKENIFSY